MPPGCWGILPMLLYMIPYGCVKLLDPKILNKIQSVLKNAELTLNARRSGRETGKRSSHLVLVIFFWVDQYSIRWVVLQDSHTWSLQSVHINRMSIFFADLIIPTPSWSFILLFFYSIIIFVYSYLCFFIVYSIFNVIFVFFFFNLFIYIYIYICRLGHRSPKSLPGKDPLRCFLRGTLPWSGLQAKTQAATGKGESMGTKCLQPLEVRPDNGTMVVNNSWN